MRPDEEGFGFGRADSRFRDELGVARVFLSAEWQGIDESGEPLVDEFGEPVLVQSEELYVGAIDNSIAQGRDQDPVTEVIDFGDPIALLFYDAFASVNVSDFNFAVYDNLIVTQFVAGLEGDYNGDGFVDAADYTVWRDSLGSTTELDADGNGNGVVDDVDFGLWVANFGSTAPAVAVPEPSGWAVMAWGSTVAGAIRVRRRARV